MNLKKIPRNSLPSIELEDKDSQNAVQIAGMLSGTLVCRKCGCENENKGWKILEGYYSNLRRWVEEVGKGHARTRAQKELCSNDFSILDGLDFAIGLPAKIVFQQNLLDEARKKSEVNNESEPTDAYE